MGSGGFGRPRTNSPFPNLREMNVRALNNGTVDMKMLDSSFVSGYDDVLNNSMDNSTVAVPMKMS